MEKEMGDQNTKKDLVEEIKENARKDRQRLEKLCDDILKLTENAELMAQEGTSVVLAEHLTRATDSLTKVNSQLVELAKLQTKKEMIEKEIDAKKGNQSDELFDEIEKDGGEPDLHN